MSTQGTPVRDETASDGTDEVSAHDGPAACPYCGERFGRARYRDLHLGHVHPEALGEAERAAVEAARDAEAEALRMFRLKALAALVVVYFGFLVVYAFTL
jgi:hypothetical protein